MASTTTHDPYKTSRQLATPVGNTHGPEANPETVAVSSQASSQSVRLRFLLLYNGLLFFWLLLKPASYAVVAAVDDVACFLGPLIAASWCFWDFFRVQDRVPISRGARPWAFLGLGAFSYGIGQAVWSYYEIIQHQACPFPSWADAGFLCGYPFLFLGIFWLPLRPLPKAGRGRVLLDGLMMMTALVTFSWYFLLGPTILAGGTTILAKVLGPAYPLADLVLLFCVLVLSAHLSHSRLRPAILLLSAGLVSIIVVDVVFGYGTLHDTYRTGNRFDVGWPLGYMLVAFAGCRLRRLSAEEKGVASPVKESRGTLPTAPKRNLILWHSLLPYAFIPAVGLLLLYVLHNHGDANLEAGVYVGAATLIGLVLLRQIFALQENGQLNMFLRDAYAEMESKNAETQHYAREMKALNDEMQVVKTALEVKNRSLSTANERLENLALTDGLTGVRNHRAFQERLWQECERAVRYGFSLSVLLLDVDRFKRYNDTYGHPAGDEVLKAVARLLEENARDSDFVGRYGGEEFVILLPHMESSSAQAAAERFRHTLEAALWEKRPITASFGLATLSASVFIPAELLAQADRALYHSKSQGRNCVTHFDQIGETLTRQGQMPPFMAEGTKGTPPV